VVDVTEREQPKQPIHWLVIQVNNPLDRRLVESEDLLRAARRHAEKPHVDIVNLTAKFNDVGEAEFTAVVEDFLVEYFQALEERGAKLGLFALSGHSNGTDMLQEVPNPDSDDPHAHWYVPKWNPRVSLGQLRRDNAAVAHQLDICETAALQACFHGGNAAAWAEIFSNEDVVIAGTRAYSPLSNSHASHAIAEGALTAREALEDGASAEAAEQLGLRVPNAATLRNDRGFVVFIRNPATAAQLARAQVDALRPSFDDAKSQIQAIRAAGERAVDDFGQATLDRMYALVLSFQNALNSLWIVDGRPEGDRARKLSAGGSVRDPQARLHRATIASILAAGRARHRIATSIDAADDHFAGPLARWWMNPHNGGRSP
jgi:hypothetical protein